MNDYPSNSLVCATACEPKASGPVEQLKQRKASLEAQLAKTTAALEALEKHPEIANVMQLVAKALY